MYRTFVHFRDKGKQYFYEGNDIDKAEQMQVKLFECYKNDDNVYSVGYELDNHAPESALVQAKTVKGKCVIHK